MTMGRADQVLTSQLFGLPSTLDRETEGLLGRYAELLGRERRPPEEEQEFLQIADRLRFRLPVPYETPAERRAEELVSAVLKVQLEVSQPEEQEQLLRKARELLEEARRS